MYLESLRISVIIATRDRPKSLARCLASLAHQNADYIASVVIVDDCSAKSKAIQTSIESLDKRFRYIHIKRSGPAIARMVGLKFAHPDSRYIFFIDDDCTADGAFIDAGVAFLSQTSHAGAGGTVRSANLSGVLRRFHQVRPTMLKPRFYPNGSVRHVYTCNSIFRHDILREVGVVSTVDFLLRSHGFILRGGEDSDLSERIIGSSYTLGYCQNMLVHHDHRSTLVPFLMQNFGYGRGLYLRKHLSKFRWPGHKLATEPKTTFQIVVHLARCIPHRSKKIYASSSALWGRRTAAALAMIEIIRLCAFWMGAVYAKLEYQLLKLKLRVEDVSRQI